MGAGIYKLATEEIGELKNEKIWYTTSHFEGWAVHDPSAAPHDAGGDNAAAKLKNKND